MNHLYEACREVHASLAGLSEWADIERLPLPRPPSLEREFDAALKLCRQSQQHAQTLICMLIADSHGVLPDRDLRPLAELAISFGLYERVIACCKRLRCIHERDDEQFDSSILEAKALRGLGRYGEAQAIYRRLLRTNQDELKRTRLLLNLAKVAHTSEWRVGYYFEMINTVIVRLRGLLAADPSPETIERLRYWLGVCLDSSAKVSLETSLLSQVVDPESTRQPFDMLTEAIAISRDDGQQGSLQRRLLHQCFFRFRLAPAAKERLGLAREFESILEELGDRNDPRGLGVRYGQLMEMQTQLGLLDEAQQSSAYALLYARLVSDWRALARNHLRAARLTRAREEPFTKFEQHVSLARTAIARLGRQHPEIEIEIEREVSLQLQAKRDLQGSHAALERITAILDRQEQRVLADFAEHSQPAAEYCPPEREVLAPAEWNRLTAALVVDYRMLSRHMRATLEQTSRLAAWGAREHSIETQLWFLDDYMSGVEHRSKNVVNMLKRKKVLDVLKEVAAEDGRESLRKAVGTLERQLSIIEDLREQAEHDRSIIRASERRFVSARQVASCLSLDFEQSLDPQLKLSLPAPDESSDFFLKTYEPLLKQVLTHLVENAGHAVRERPNAAHEIEVRTTIRTDASGRRWGRLEIEDTGAGAQGLRSALERIAGTDGARDQRLRVSGLFLAHRYFQTFHARVEVDELPGGRTVLRVDFPHDGIHVQVGRGEAVNA